MATRSRTAPDGSMDLLCDTLMVEEILPLLLPKDLLRLGAGSRRYNALVGNPDFAARYWRRPRAGVCFQPLLCPTEPFPLFLTGGREPSTDLVSGADLSFLPGPSAREKAHLQSVGALDSGSVAVVVHSAAGLLLCSRGRVRVRPVHYYVCNPVTCQWVALPEQPWPSSEWMSGILRVDTGEDGVAKRFQVVLFNHPMHWQYKGACFDLTIFSSDTGQWETMQLRPPVVLRDYFVPPPILGHSGTAYWIRCQSDEAIAYNSVDHSVHVIPLPECLADGPIQRTIGERLGGVSGTPIPIQRCLRCGIQRKEEVGISCGCWYIALMLRNYWNKTQKQLLFCMMEPQAFGATTPHQWASTQLTRMLSSSVCLDPCLAIPIEHSTMDLQCTHAGCPNPYYMFPYVHPPHLMQIPAIKNSILAS